MIERMTRKIHVIVNPAAGQPQPILYILNSVFRRYNVKWDLSVCKRKGDGQRYAGMAVRAGADVVAAYGGDGTITEVACGLIEAQKRGEGRSELTLNGCPYMAILPGGTANLLSIELGIPKDLTQAVELAANPNSFARRVDAGRVTHLEGRILSRMPAVDPATHHSVHLDRAARFSRAKTYFLLRVGIGFAARKVRIADRQLKRRYGLLAYSIAGLVALQQSSPANYRLVLDGEEINAQGLTCLVDNASNIGIAGIGVGVASVSDGLLDVILVKNSSFRSWLAMGAHLAGADRQFDSFMHFQAKNIRIEAEPSQPVQLDGELTGRTPLEIEVLPNVLEILTPS